MTESLEERVRSGEHDFQMTVLTESDFTQETEPYRRELTAHCYRMVGSVLEADDLVQETFLRAWKGRAGYAGRASVRAWLYRIATNVSLDFLATRKVRRTVPRLRQPVSGPDEAVPASVDEPVWLEPFPQEPPAPAHEQPEARFTARESLTLAFMTALHRLPARQRAVLLLRDVLGWQASEVGEALDMTVLAVKAALHRARTSLQLESTEPIRLTAEQSRRLEDYLLAWEQADVEALVALLTQDVVFSMPPIPSWYQGRDSVEKLVRNTVFRGDSGGRWKLVPVPGQDQPTFGLYRLGEAYAVQLLRVSGSGIAEVITFRVPALVERFGLPGRL